MTRLSAEKKLMLLIELKLFTTKPRIAVAGKR